MTELQKQTIKLLLQGGSIAATGIAGYRVRNAKNEVELKINSSSFSTLKSMLRRTKVGLWVIDFREVRKLHNGTWVKKEYKKLLSAD